MTHILRRFTSILLAGAASAACAPYEPFEGGGGISQPAYPVRAAQAQTAPPPYGPPPAPPPYGPGAAAAETRMQEPDARPASNQPGYVTPSTPRGDDLPPPAPQPAPQAVVAPPPTNPPRPEPPRPPPPRYRTITKTSVAGRVVEVDGPRVTYTVKRGDNLEKIARKLDLDLADLAKDNNLKKPYRLHPGDVLKGPPTKQKAYVVGSGDTLSAIARRFSVASKALALENDLNTRASLKPGQRVRLPKVYRDTGPIKTVTQELIETPPPPRPTYTPPRTAYATPAPAPAYTPQPYGPAPAATPAPLPAERPPSVVYTAPAPQPTPASPATPPVSTYPRPPAVVATAPPAARPSYPLPPPPPPAPAAPRPVTSVPGPPIVPSPTPGDAQIAELGRGLFLWPVRGDIVLRFGPKGQGLQNDGINIRAPAGEPVRAAAAGDIVYAGDQVPGFGNLVLIKHANGWVTAYGHLARSDVKMQQKVAQGQQIGTVGATGGVPEPQLHFEIRYAPTPADRAKPFDPTLVLPR